MVQEENQSLEERCFLLGLNRQYLPLEPEPLDRVAYNLGKKAKQLDSIIWLDLMYSTLRFYERIKDDGWKSSNKEEAKKAAYGTLENLYEKDYEELCQIIKQNPITKPHLKSSKERFEKQLQEYRDGLDKIFSDENSG